MEAQVEYLPRKVDTFIKKIPDEYFGQYGSSKKELAAFLKNKIAQLKEGESMGKLKTGVARRIVNDTTCPNAPILIDIFEMGLNYDFNSDPIIGHTPQGKEIKKLNLDETQLVTFANFCNFVDKMEIEETIVSRSQLKEVFYDVLRTNPYSNHQTVVEKFGFFLFRVAHIGLEKYGETLKESDYAYLNKIYIKIRDAAEKNFVVADGAFYAPADKKETDPLEKLDSYSPSRRYDRIADEPWRKDDGDDDLPN